MKVSELRAMTGAVALGATLAGLAGCATAKSDITRPVVQQTPADSKTTAEAVTPPPAPALASKPPTDAAANSTVNELQSLIQSRQVAELRTTYNGTYGASLLFKADDLNYYIALFQQKEFWRVIKTSSEKQAEDTYKSFTAKSAKLAEVDLRRIRLQAESARAGQLLAARNAQLTTLQADLAVRQQQEQQVAVRQAQSRQEAALLANQQKDVREQLRQLQNQIDALQAQQADLSDTAMSRNAGKRNTRAQ